MKIKNSKYCKLKKFNDQPSKDSDMEVDFNQSSYK